MIKKNLTAISKVLDVVIIVFCVLAFTLWSYNRIINNDERVNQAWSDIEATLQRRADLLPNLARVVKSYTQYESETLNNIVKNRSKSISIASTSTSNAEALEKANRAFNTELNKLLAIVENYSKLKASDNYRDLQHQIEGTENRISVIRQKYNKAVTNFNTNIRTFPGNIINSTFFKLSKKELFTIQNKQDTKNIEIFANE